MRSSGRTERYQQPGDARDEPARPWRGDAVNGIEAGRTVLVITQCRAEGSHSGWCHWGPEMETDTGWSHLTCTRGDVVRVTLSLMCHVLH